MWAYSRALITFREQGDVRAARDHRAFAVRVNQFVPDYLSGRARMPKFPPDYVSPGEKSEAVSYVYDNRQAWMDTAHAIEWLLSGLKPGN